MTVRLVPIHTTAPQAELTVTTAADGSYSFTGLSPGEYDKMLMSPEAADIDSDGDGLIQEAELVTWRETVFLTMDADGDDVEASTKRLRLGRVGKGL